MSLVFIDGFDHYLTADIAKKYSEVNQVFLQGPGLGRQTPMVMAFDNWSDYFGLAGLPPHATWIVGLAFKMNATSWVTANRPLFNLMEGSIIHATLNVSTSGQLYFTRNGTLIGSYSPEALLVGVWYYIEAKVTIGDSGSIEARVNEKTVIGPTTADTRNGGTGLVDHVRFLDGGGSSVTASYLDDVYICNGDGSSNNDFLGDVVVESVYPSAGGATTEWTPSAGSNYECVDELQFNSDTDYVETNVSGEKDTYAMGNLATPAGSVYGVQAVVVARKTTAGSRTIAPVIRHSGTDYVGSNKEPSISYAVFREINETNPGTAAAWTIGDVNSIEFGQKVTA